MPKCSLLCFAFVLLSSHLLAPSAQKSTDDLVQCLTDRTLNISEVIRLIHTPQDPTYTPIYDLLLQELRFMTNSTPKPRVIITPLKESHIEATIYCSKKHGFQIRIRSGGHDFEGSSYISEVPFVVLDLFRLNSIKIDVGTATAWVQSGATLGQFYYAISQKSRTLAFPAGYWSTVGVGGHLAGGGYGALLRKYGLAADQVIDALIMDVNGAILNRSSMGEDLFWAIRGGGHGNFGVIVAWKVKLVAVPETVTVFKVNRTLEQGATKLVHKWQYVAPSMHKDLTMTLRISSIKKPRFHRHRTMLIGFESLFLGGADRLLVLMNTSFPELGLTREDCLEMSWIQSVLELGDVFPKGSSTEILLNRTAAPKQYTKQKADFVEKPISVRGLRGIWKVFSEIEAEAGGMNWTPCGGRMSEIPASEIPYPHRAGNIFLIYEAVYWDGEKIGPVSPRHVSWVRKLHGYLTPYVSKNPRFAYANYRDYDLGVNNISPAESQSVSWGIKYFKNNFNRLVKVKTKVDPDNFFKNEQSIPPSNVTTCEANFRLCPISATFSLVSSWEAKFPLAQDKGLFLHIGSPFCCPRLVSQDSINIDVETATAWVQSGANLGQFNYAISYKSRTLAFPAGYWSTVGVGGHLAGGGYGALLKKYGLAADHVIDALIMDVNGAILNRSSMGEDLFWAIRGGGHGNFGVIIAWKRKETQKVRRRTMLIGFESLFLGRADKLLVLMNTSLPELGLTREDCMEMSWIESVLELGDVFPKGSSTKILLNRTAVPKQYTKQKADYVEKPISVEGLEGIWKVFSEIEAEAGGMNWTPYGGRMSEIPDSEIAYPHRAGNIFLIYEAVY
ncbi:hypothetical protein RJ639_009204 [Escallonia herrerae]|uniref:FAD-binding PCMH-type domain-containing protein n=1 Tax=Escallonia herrerae TaxID=1293975 RepID=A0AA89ATU0_9ASTE|nr:hypothetical protein RJ639_009204 [Escallonia herrerae]